MIIDSVKIRDRDEELIREQMHWVSVMRATPNTKFSLVYKCASFVHFSLGIVLRPRKTISLFSVLQSPSQPPGSTPMTVNASLVVNSLQ